MLIDPVLVSWVPKWVREQYERANPYFRRVLEKLSVRVFKSNHRFLLRVWKLMVSVHEKAVLRKSRAGKEQADDGSSSDLDGGDVGPGFASDEEDRSGDAVPGVQGHDDDAVVDRDGVSPRDSRLA